jgi:hypothetical protein
MTGETKRSAQRAHPLWPRCIWAVRPRIRVCMYLSIYLIVEHYGEVEVAVHECLQTQDLGVCHDGI